MFQTIAAVVEILFSSQIFLQFHYLGNNLFLVISRTDCTFNKNLEQETHETSVAQSGFSWGKHNRNRLLFTKLIQRIDTKYTVWNLTDFHST
jgi:hypothetical protein